MMNEPFPRNQWYVAAAAHELGDVPVGRTICGEPVVLFRDRGGKATMLEDRCPHRKYALSVGKLIDGELQCGYHGLRFDGSGACTLIPSQSDIPRGLSAHKYPTVERYGLVFAWMGDAARADAALIPDLHQNTAPGWTAIYGYILVKGNYMLMVDNLLDLTHVSFLHPSTLAGPGILENPLEVTQDGDLVRARRYMPDVAPAPIHSVVRHYDGNIDRCQTLEFRPPAYVHVIVGARPAGSDEDIEQPSHVVINCLTPETERSTHYFWSVARWRLPDDQAMSDTLRKMHDTAFAEDISAIEIQQARIDSDASGAPLANLDGDKAGVHARRIVRKLIKAESRPASVGAGG